jgi:hypothetical protein
MFVNLKKTLVCSCASFILSKSMRMFRGHIESLIAKLHRNLTYHVYILAVFGWLGRGNEHPPKACLVELIWVEGPEHSTSAYVRYHAAAAEMTDSGNAAVSLKPTVARGGFGHVSLNPTGGGGPSSSSWLKPTGGGGPSSSS